MSIMFWCSKVTLFFYLACKYSTKMSYSQMSQCPSILRMFFRSVTCVCASELGVWPLPLFKLEGVIFSSSVFIDWEFWCWGRMYNCPYSPPRCLHAIECPTSLSPWVTLLLFILIGHTVGSKLKMWVHFYVYSQWKCVHVVTKKCLLACSQNNICNQQNLETMQMPISYRMANLRYIRTTEYYMALRANDLQSHTTIGMNLNNTILKKPDKKRTYYLAAFI